MSRRVMTTLAQQAPEVEIYSIDEAFMNLRGISAAADFARHVRATVRQHTCIPVSIGIGPTKTLAKIANRIAKKSPELGGVYDLNHGERETALASVAVGDVWGIGRQWSAWLEGQGIKTACDLMQADAKAIRQKMTVTGERIVYELRGVSCLPLELAPPPQKGVTVSRSFGQLLTELAPIEEALTHFASRAGEKLRKQGLMARQLSIFLETNRFSKTRPIYAKSVSLKLPYPSDYTPELIHYGLRALRQIYKAGYHYQKCGIMCLDLVATSRMRTDLLDARDQTRLATLMQTMDDINTRYGRGTAHFGAWGDARGAEPRWTMRSDHCSPRYTTSWAELARVR